MDREPGSPAAAIEFREVTKRYEGREGPAVRELTLSVPAGEICVLIGPFGRRQDDGDEDGQPPDPDHRAATSRIDGRSVPAST